MRPNNYVKVVQDNKVETVYTFDDRDLESAVFALRLAKHRQTRLGDSAKTILWRIPDEPDEADIYKGLPSSNICPLWAHDWQPSEDIRSCGQLCSRCGQYDRSGELAAAQRLTGLHSKALSELGTAG